MHVIADGWLVVVASGRPGRFRRTGWAARLPTEVPKTATNPGRCKSIRQGRFFPRTSQIRR